MIQVGQYTAAISSQAVTLTPEANVESQPTHQAASTIVFNTVATTPPPELWAVGGRYRVTIEKLT